MFFLIFITRYIIEKNTDNDSGTYYIKYNGKTEKGGTLERYKDLSNNLDVKYNYDVNGIRTNINGIDTKYYLENADIIYEQRGNNKLYYLYCVVVNDVTPKK